MSQYFTTHTKLSSKQKNERAEWYEKDIREWWVANKDTFIILMSKKD